MRIVVHNSHPITGKGEKFRKCRTSLPPAHLPSTGEIIERLYICTKSNVKLLYKLSIKIWHLNASFAKISHDLIVITPCEFIEIPEAIIT